MLKVGTKRRRSKMEMLADKEADSGMRESYQFACSETSRLQRELDLIKGQMMHSQKAQDFADNMIKEGYVKTDELGDIVLVSEEERH
jgi:hypothetical protein